jgi:hypothetical protein
MDHKKSIASLNDIEDDNTRYDTNLCEKSGEDGTLMFNCINKIIENEEGLNG